MVQCVSSSEQDMAESREHAWPVTRNDFNSDTDTQSMISNTPMMRQRSSHNPVESTDMHFNQNMNSSSMNNQQVMPMTSNYYERTQTYKRKNDFGDPSTYRPDKIMRTANYNMVHGLQKETDYDSMGMSSPDKTQSRHFPLSGTSSDSSSMPKVLDRHNMGPGDGARTFAVGDVVWGPARGYASWPGKLRARLAGGRWAVRWFGALGAAALPQARLLTLSEGLDLHHAARTKHRKSRKLNTLLENAIQEAMAELDKKSESVSERDESAGERDNSAGERDNSAGERDDSAGEPDDSAGERADSAADVTAAPRRARKPDKARRRDRPHKKPATKLAPGASSGGGSRLRSSR